jgi:hypothetical protein
MNSYRGAPTGQAFEGVGGSKKGIYAFGGLLSVFETEPSLSHPAITPDFL